MLAVHSLIAFMPLCLMAAQINGHVSGPDDAPLPGVSITLSNDVIGYSRTTSSADDGTYHFYNVPENGYHVVARLKGFADAARDLEVHGAVPVTQDLELKPTFSTTTTVTGVRPEVALETESSESTTHIDKSLIHRFAAQNGARAFESIVLSAPGFSKDENGRYHFQGGHSQQLVVIDGQPIGDQIGITFSNSLDPSIADSISIVTGGVPAEYGEKAYGVIDLTTRSALGSPGFQGEASVGGGSFSTYEGSVSLGHGAADSGLFADLDYNSSDRFLDPVSFDDFHNHGDTTRGFVRYDRLTNRGSDSWRVTASGGSTRRDVTNLPSQQIAGQDQRVHTNDWNFNLGYQHVGSANWVFDGLIFGRNNTFKIDPSAADTPVTTSQDRTLGNQGVRGSLTRVLGDHEIKGGLEVKRFPIDERFSFGVTDPGFNDPASEEYNPNLAPFDLSRGGVPFAFSQSKTGTYTAVFLQDTYRHGPLTVNAGLRYDENRLFISENLLQPRIGLAYFIHKSKTVLRASYDRMFITPEYENILLSSSEAAAALVPPEIQASRQLGFGELFNRSERHNAYEVGLEQGLGRLAKLDMSVWRRDVTNAADQDQFFNTGVVFPLNFKAGNLRGWNVRLDGGPTHGLRGYLSLGHVHAIYDPPFVGGLFLDTEALDSLSAGPFLIDHDQELQQQLGLFWDIGGSGVWLGATERYDSGLVTDAGTISEVLSSPDTAYAAPYIRFGADPQRIRPRTTVDLSLGVHLKRYGLPLEAQFDVLNVGDVQGLYNFQSVFGGTHVIPPRTYAVHLRYTM